MAEDLSRAGEYKITASAFHSLVSTGRSPFTVESSTTVVNLGASTSISSSYALT